MVKKVIVFLVLFCIFDIYTFALSKEDFGVYNIEIKNGTILFNGVSEQYYLGLKAPGIVKKMETLCYFIRSSRAGDGFIGTIKESFDNSLMAEIYVLIDDKGEVIAELKYYLEYNKN